MNINSSGLETAEQLVVLGEDLAQNFQTRSFRCAFCKRGFSNAQALGGHMNIHRKDRAKLREFSDENLLSLEISRSPDYEESLPRDPSLGEKLSLENDESHEDDDDQAESVKGKPPRGLPLFAEAPPSVNGGESRKVELKYGELDLELRLGPEPNHHAKSKP
ncbi:hypothetical protein C2S52_019499 [Perilla frutescens var. hirtella]|uniref:C2H2-type domain-containing protein n=1 Tax=Perilla frutescens var. hirtella TaxID=608512 RepID=A0AAD4J970_PERFH|nr:hypothetical protein C2S52_019499 [Perilla frutescens var. hirtella]KAH6806232.1 hypothetical protein C2S51_031063 [Perilla frutescens var. frutescens]KAH6829484.1 hypothetical protein C2S53_015981 [Perilla frutescens var. hirtella]